jgi:hypothetical protein
MAFRFNIADVIDTNAPSPYWVNDDDYVAGWMNTHPRTDLSNSRLRLSYEQSTHCSAARFLSTI